MRSIALPLTAIMALTHLSEAGLVCHDGSCAMNPRRLANVKRQVDPFTPSPAVPVAVPVARAAAPMNAGPHLRRPHVITPAQARNQRRVNLGRALLRRQAAGRINDDFDDQFNDDTFDIDDDDRNDRDDDRDDRDDDRFDRDDDRNDRDDDPLDRDDDDRFDIDDDINDLDDDRDFDKRQRRAGLTVPDLDDLDDPFDDTPLDDIVDDDLIDGDEGPNDD